MAASHVAHYTTRNILYNIYTGIVETTSYHLMRHPRTYRAHLDASYQYIQHRHKKVTAGLAQGLLLQFKPNNNDYDDERNPDAGGQSNLVGPGFVEVHEAMRAARRAVKKVSNAAQAILLMPFSSNTP